MSVNIPNTFQHPNWFVDSLMYLLTPQENIVLTFITRHILGWEKERLDRQRSISLSMMTDGWTDGSGNIYHGTGLGLSANRKAANALAAFGIINVLGVSQKGTLYELPAKPNIDMNALEKCYQDRQQKHAVKTHNATLKKAQVSAGKTPLSSHDTPIVPQTPTPIVTRYPTPIVPQQESNPTNQSKESVAANAGDPPQKKDLTSYQAFMKRYCELLMMDIKTAKGKITQNAANLWQKGNGYTIEDLETFAEWWASDNNKWRNQSPPNIANVNDDILKAKRWYEEKQQQPPPGEAPAPKPAFRVEYLPDPDDPNTMIQIKTAVEAQ